MPFLAGLATRLRAQGFDLTSSCSVGRYNSSVAPEFAVDDLSDRSNTVVLIGNSRDLWPRFLTFLRSNPSFLSHKHPLDDYTRDCITESLQGLPEHRVYFSRDRVQLQNLASVSGLCYFSKAVFLCQHPTYGPWIGLRCAVVVRDSFVGPEPPEVSCPCPECESAQKERMQHLLELFRTPGYSIERDPQPWIEMRSLCPHAGAEWRYSDAQMMYHYTKDKSILRREIAETQTEAGTTTETHENT